MPYIPRLMLTGIVLGFATMFAAGCSPTTLYLLSAWQRLSMHGLEESTASPTHQRAWHTQVCTPFDTAPVTVTLPHTQPVNLTKHLAAGSASRSAATGMQCTVYLPRHLPSCLLAGSSCMPSTVRGESSAVFVCGEHLLLLLLLLLQVLGALCVMWAMQCSL
jgi:hypothetical protein